MAALSRCAQAILKKLHDDGAFMMKTVDLDEYASAELDEAIRDLRAAELIVDDDTASRGDNLLAGIAASPAAWLEYEHLGLWKPARP